MSEALYIEDLGSLQDVLDADGWVVVNFTATEWCNPCRQFLPHFLKAAEASGDVFVEYDVHYDSDAADKYNFMSVPTTILFHNGTEVTRLTKRTVVSLLSEIDQAKG